MADKKTDKKPSRKAPAKGKKPAAKAAKKPAGKSAEPDVKIPPEFVDQVEKLRASVRENFGKAAMAMMMLPRYRNQAIGDMQHLILEPLMRDRLAMAYPRSKDDDEKQLPREMIGFALWANVSEEVDARITEQIKTGTFPVRLKADEWTSGDIKWLFDIVAPTKEATVAVLANFRQVAGEGQLKMHPLIGRLLPKETLEQLGASKLGDAKPADNETIN